MDFPEFDHMGLDELRLLLEITEQDGAFLRRLANAIAEREKTFGTGPGARRSLMNWPGRLNGQSG